MGLGTPAQEKTKNDDVGALALRLVVAVFGKNMVLRLLALIRLSENHCGRYARTAWIKTP
jgi:hypothetical protein